MKAYTNITVIVKCVMLLQNCRDFLKFAPGEDSETCYESQSIDIKDEDDTGVQEEEHPILITSPVIKAEQEVCLCKHSTVIITVTRWCHRKRPKHCSHFLNYCACQVSSCTPNLSTSALWLHQRHLAVKQGGNEKCL
jgi:hypothetical protein